MNYLLDTNICIYIIKKKPNSVIERLAKLSNHQIFISSITLAELEYGIRKSSLPEKNLLALKEFLQPLTIVNFDSSAAAEYGVIRSELEEKGTPIGSLDTLIAAHALSLNYIMITNNVKEFARIDRLKYENWVN